MNNISHQIAEQQNQQQNLTLLKIYSSYRLLIAIALLVSFFIFEQNRIVGNVKPVLFIYASSFYLLLSLINISYVLPRTEHLGRQRLFLTFFIDIIAIIAIADSTGGVKSGLEIFLVVIIAASSIMLPGQLATLLAAIASLFMLADTYRLVGQHHLDSGNFFQTGILGIVLFGTCFFIQSLVQRIRRSQLEAELNAVEVLRQQQLNHLIVQRMQTGIIVTDNSGHITTCNQAASELLNHENDTNNSSGKLPTLLIDQLHEWLKKPQLRTLPFKLSESGAELQANFSALDNEHETLIFLENNQQLSQRAQDMKLASLGRLTASIAHEIRNPLGAISHAAQLLKESTHLDDTDTRLNNIIHNHCKRMNQVIENVLQLSRRSAPSPETINIGSWLTFFLHEFSNDNSTADIKIILSEVDCQTTIDCSQLSQVLTNLIENGLRYSKKKTGIASLTLQVAFDNNSQLPYLDVIDGGEGISEEQRAHLFEPFYTTERNGTGLGLFIAREMCEANQIRISYFMNEDNKSCFRLNFPHYEKRLIQNNTKSYKPGK